MINSRREIKKDTKNSTYKQQDLMKRNSIIFWTLTVITILSFLPRVSVAMKFEIVIQLVVMVAL